jgi:hypothetical protein
LTGYIPEPDSGRRNGNLADVPDTPSAILIRIVIPNYFDPSYVSVCESHLDAMRMGGGTGKDPFDNSFGQLAGALILLLHDLNTIAWFDVRSFPTVHR